MSRPETLREGMTRSTKDYIVKDSSGALLRVFVLLEFAQILELSVKGSPIQMGLFANHSTNDFK